MNIMTKVKHRLIFDTQETTEELPNLKKLWQIIHTCDLFNPTIL